MSKEITIPVPDGKCAEWINGVLTLVDEQKVDNRPVTERIKTLADAMEALGQGNPLVEEYIAVRDKLRTDVANSLLTSNSVSSSLPSMKDGSRSLRKMNAVTSLGSLSTLKKSMTS